MLDAKPIFLQSVFVPIPSDVSISFLPLAHMFERVVQVSRSFYICLQSSSLMKHCWRPFRFQASCTRIFYKSHRWISFTEHWSHACLFLFMCIRQCCMVWGEELAFSKAISDFYRTTWKLCSPQYFQWFHVFWIVFMTRYEYTHRANVRAIIIYFFYIYGHLSICNGGQLVDVTALAINDNILVK